MGYHFQAGYRDHDTGLIRFYQAPNAVGEDGNTEDVEVGEWVDLKVRELQQEKHMQEKSHGASEQHDLRVCPQALDSLL